MTATKFRHSPIFRTSLLFLSVLVPALLTVVLVSVSNYRREIRAESAIIEKNEELLISFERTLIANQLNSILEDVKFLAGDPELSVDDYVSFLERKSLYSELTIVDPSGAELIRLDYRNRTARLASSDSLTNIGEREYFQSAAKLPDETIFVSRLDLDASYSGIDEPIIWFAAPVRQGPDPRYRIIILAYRANHIIRRVREAATVSFGHAMLLDPNGYWIHSHRQSDLWGFIRPERSNRTFATDYPEIWPMVTKMDAGTIQGEDATFIFATVYPLMDPQMDNPGSMWHVVHDFPEEEGYYWHIVTHVPLSMVKARAEESRRRIVSSGVMFGFGFLLFSLILAVMRWRRIQADSKIAEEASIFAHNPAPVLRADGQGHIVKANPAAHLAFSGDPITNQSIEVFSALDADAIASIQHGHSHQFEQKLGESYYYFSAKRDPSDGSLLFYGSDITSRKEIQKEISRLSTAVEQSATAILITDLGGHIIFANTACAQSSGYSVDELVGMHTRVLRSGEQGPDVYNELWSTISAGHVWTGEMHNRRKDGGLYWEEMSITPVRDDTGVVSGYLAVKEDITRRRETERQLTRAKEEAESASRLKSEFLANMSHEIRTPMNAILGFTDFLIDDEKDTDRLKNLRIIKNSGKHLLSLINDILDFSKIEADRVDIEVAPFAFHGLLEHIEGLMRESIRAKGLYLRAELAPGVPAAVQGDEHRITQILLNILGNAVKFTESGGITIRCTYNSGTATLAVSDTGVGIAEEKLEEIFSPFQQATSTTERTYGGTGLGLAICRRLADLMNGRIWVESTPGRGSTFSLAIPLPEIDAGDVELLEPVEEADGTENAQHDRPSHVDGRMVASWLRGAGTNDKLRRVVLRGIRDLPVKLEKLKRALQESDIVGFANIAHDVKGYTGNLHLTEAYEAAERLYARVQKGDFNLDDAPEALEELEAIVGKIPPSALVGSEEAEDLIESFSSPIRILTAEDNETNQELVRILLDGIGLESDFVGDGKAVLACLEQGRYDLLLLDMQMPVMNGIDTIQAIREDGRFSDLHVIAITAHAMEGDSDKYLSIGCNDYLSKPIDRALFTAKVTEVMHRRSVHSGTGPMSLADIRQGEISEIIKALGENEKVFNPRVLLDLSARLAALSTSPEIQAISARIRGVARDLDGNQIPEITEALRDMLVRTRVE